MEQHNRHGTDKQANGQSHLDDEGDMANFYHQATNDASFIPSSTIVNQSLAIEKESEPLKSKENGLKISLR